MRGHPFIVVAFVTVATTLPASANPPATLPGRVVGVLTLPGEYAWGVHYEAGFPWEWGRTQSSSPHQTFRFLVAADSYAPYFSAQAGDRNAGELRVDVPGKSGNTATPFAVDNDSAARARALGVDRPVHLVEVEVNGGRGGAGSHFVITSLRMVEGTKEVPWKLEDQLTSLRRRFDEIALANRPALKRELAAARRKLLVNLPGKILRKLPPEEIVIYQPSWNPATKQLEVYFGLKLQAGFWIKTKPQRGGNPHVKHAPPPPERGLSYLATIGARFVVDSSGTIVAEDVFPPKSSSGPVPWYQPPVASPPSAGNSKRRYFRSCGDNVCQTGGYRGPYPKVSVCQSQREGAACSKQGETCDLHNDCNMFLICSERDPATTCPR